MAAADRRPKLEFGELRVGRSVFKVLPQRATLADSRPEVVVSESPLLRLSSATGAPRLLGTSHRLTLAVAVTVLVPRRALHSSCACTDGIYRRVDSESASAKKSFNKDKEVL